MKSIKNIFAAGLLVSAMGLGMTSCIGDLDVTPSDPNTLTWADVEKNPDLYLPELLGKCYAELAVSGQGGAGSSDISGLDNGTSCYSRAIFMLNEFPTDEALWIYQDAGIIDLVTGTWARGNVNIYGTYSRLYVAIAVCNDYIRNLNSSGIDMTSPTAVNCAAQYKLEARAIRALSYWYVLDLFGNGGWVDDTMNYGDNPTPITRRDLYDKLVTELKDIIASWPANLPTIYGRVGLDGVKALLAKVYLNASVYTNGEVNGYQDCLGLCNEIIANHQGGGFQGSGLANHYLALFSANNDRYMPGGSKSDENEILWGVPYEGTYTQSYGGSTFLVAAAVTNNGDADVFSMKSGDYGAEKFNWKCMHARSQFSDKFTDSGDVRDDFWSKESNGFQKENTIFNEFSNGYASVKFTNLLTNDDGTFPLVDQSKGTVISNIAESAKVNNVYSFADTDLPIFRLADIYLMRAECRIVGGVGNDAEALAGLNYVRERAGASKWNSIGAVSTNELLNERARELYWENHRRTDLVRFNRFVSNYTWSWKGNVANGTDLGSYMNVFPIPSNVIAAQPEFEAYQNKGY